MHLKAKWFDLDGQVVTAGEYCPLTKSLYKSSVDAAQIFNGTISQVNNGSMWAIVKVGNKRLVIGL